jgi:2-deoxy-D-gluconate 3-dehydrogenase
MIMNDLKGKIAVVTGGRRGIGRAFAVALNNAGCKVVAIAKSKDRGDLPVGVQYVSMDLSKPEKRVLDLEHVDILINNAGMGLIKPAIETTYYEWLEVMEVNVAAVFDLSCQVASLGCKRIINISSINGVNSARNVSAYTSSKHAVIGLTKSLSNEWAGNGVTVNCIVPGYIQTDMLDLKAPQTIMGRIPVGRFGIPEDLVPLMMLLVSDEARYMTGGVYPVDGGWLAR